MKKNERVDLKEYKKKLIETQGWICPVTQQYIEEDHVDIIFLMEHDWAISKTGLDQLRTKYGDMYINSKIVYGMEVATEDQVVRDIG